MASIMESRIKAWRLYALCKLGAGLRSVAQGRTMPFFRELSATPPR